MENTYEYNQYRTIPAIVAIGIILAFLFRNLVPIHYIILICALTYMLTGRTKILITHDKGFYIKTGFFTEPYKVEYDNLKSIKIDINRITLQLKDGKNIQLPISICEPSKQDALKGFFEEIKDLKVPSENSN